MAAVTRGCTSGPMPAKDRLHDVEQVWIQHDGTSTGVANDLLARGIPEGALVLAFQHPSLRRTA